MELRNGLAEADVVAIRDGIRGHIAAIAPSAWRDQDGYPGHPDGLPHMIEGLALIDTVKAVT